MPSVARTALLVSLAFAAQVFVVDAASDQPKGDYSQCLKISPGCPVNATLYGYYPNMGANAFFTALFGVCFIATIVIGIMTKTWTYTLALGIGTFLETGGYIGRVIMHQNPWSSGGFKLQICCLVLAPSFIAAAIYLTLKHFVLYCGPQHSLIKARLYPWIFIGCDLFSIVLQACGGGMAAAGGTNKEALIDSGNHLIVAGIAFQVVTMIVCGFLMLVYIWRYRKARSVRPEHNEKSVYALEKEQGAKLGKVRLFGWLIALAYITILIRCIYRVPEMAGGWGNSLMRNEKEFLLLDGM